MKTTYQSMGIYNTSELEEYHLYIMKKVKSITDLWPGSNGHNGIYNYWIDE